MRLTRVPAATVIAVTIALAGLANAGGGVSTQMCRISNVQLAIGPLVSEKTEQHTATFKLTNGAPTACTLDGYPAVAFFGGRGRLLPFIYSHRGDQMITGARPTLIDLRPRASAFFAVNKNACVAHTTRTARMMRIALPASPAKHSISLPRYPIIDHCAGSDPGAVVTVSPIERTPQGTACLFQGSCRRKS